MNQNKDTTIFNDQKYDVSLDFMGDKNNVAQTIFKSYYKIVIHENLYDPFYSVEIEYKDDSHAFEKGSNIEFKNTNKPINIGYRYRGDGHDKVVLKIQPHDNIVSKDCKESINFECLLCVVDSFRTYNPEINHYTKTLILEDYTKWILSERQSLFTTRSIDPYAAYRTNEQRSMLTGHAILNLIADKLGYNVINKSSWDIGDSYIFYSASANEKALDTLYNLLKLHNSKVSNNDDICFLNHSIGDSMWSLTSLNNMYNNAIIKPNKPGILHIGKIYINTSADSPTQVNSIYTPVNALENEKSSKALYYDFKDMCAKDATNLNSHIVYNYNNNNKEFYINCNDGYIDTFRNDFFKNYSKKMIGKNDSAYPNIPLTNVKKYNYSFTNVFNLYENVNISVSRNRLLNIASILNNGIEVTTLGDTMRRPGYFISIDSKTPGAPNDFNSKIFGDYLIVSTDHVFIESKYTTSMICTKPYVYNKPENEPKELIDG